MVIDVILIILFVLMIVYGYKKGCIALASKLASLVIAFILAYALAKVTGAFILETNIGVHIKGAIESKVLGELQGAETEQIILALQEQFGLPASQLLSDKVVSYVFTGIGFITIFILARIVLWIAEKILESIFELPVLKTFNKLGGVIIAGALMIIEISIILAVIKSMSTLTFMTGIINVINNSVIVKILYAHNIVTNLFMNIIL